MHIIKLKWITVLFLLLRGSVYLILNPFEFEVMWTAVCYISCVFLVIYVFLFCAFYFHLYIFFSNPV